MECKTVDNGYADVPVIVMRIRVLSCGQYIVVGSPNVAFKPCGDKDCVHMQTKPGDWVCSDFQHKSLLSA